MQESRADRAVHNRFKKKYNCCQSVLLAYNDLVDLPDNQAFEMASVANSGANVGVHTTFESYDRIIYYRYLALGCGFAPPQLFDGDGALNAVLLLSMIKENPLAGNVSERQVERSEFALSLVEKFKERFKGETNCGRLSGNVSRSSRSAPCEEIIRYCCKLVEDEVFPGEFEPFEM